MKLKMAQTVDTVTKQTIKAFFETQIRITQTKPRNSVNFLESGLDFPESTITAIINFSSDELSGGLTITAYTSTVLKLANAFTGCPVGTMMFLTPEAKDAFGEFANIVSGEVKTALEQATKTHLTSSPPFIFSGSNMSVSVGQKFDASKFYFTSDVGNFIIELIIGGTLDLS
ncbi:MAG: chemotaxis protein CheX [Magnetococcales bacterium]|nr:chemotaxis protein CheX [Magnetococcales bacterium]